MPNLPKMTFASFSKFTTISSFHFIPIVKATGGGGPGVKNWFGLISEILVRWFQRFLRNLKSLPWCRVVSLCVFENIGVSIHFANFKCNFPKMHVFLNKISPNYFFRPIFGLDMPNDGIKRMIRQIFEIFIFCREMTPFLAQNGIF